MGYNIFLPRWKVAQRSHVIEEDPRHGRADLRVGRRRWLLALLIPKTFWTFGREYSRLRM